MAYENEVEVELRTSADKTQVTLELVGDKPLEIHDVIMALEGFLTELVRAHNQRSNKNVLEH